MKIVVHQVENPQAKTSTNLAEIRLAPLEDNPSRLGSASRVQFINGASIKIKAALESRKLAVAVDSGEAEVFVGICQWDQFAPYFVFQLPDRTYIQLFGGE
jgi:hypothetical protein